MSTEQKEFFESIWRDDPGLRYISTCVPGNEKSFQNFAFETNDQAIGFAVSEIERGKDVYFAPHLFELGTEGRKKENAKSCTAIYLDIDCGTGKDYSSQEDAAKAIQKTLEGTGLPMPTTIVNSGYGLHLYWILREALDGETWTATARQLEAICKSQGLKVDRSVTKDRARIMRYPGSSNRKNPEHPKECEILSDEIQVFDPADFQAILANHAPAIPNDNASEINNLFLAGLENDTEFSKAAAKVCLPFLSIQQLSEYDSWMKVCFSLHNTFDGSDEGLQLWDDASKRSGKYKPGVCSAKWQTAESERPDGERATAGTLHEMAKEAGGDEFLKAWEQFMSEQKSEALIARASEVGCTDMGNARRLVMLHGENIRFDYARKIWYAWTGTHWAEDAEPEVMQLAKATVREIYREAAKTENEYRRKNLASWAKASESGGHLREMVRLATDEKDIQTSISDFDKHPHLLCVENGVVNLRTGKLRSHDRDLMMTRCLPIPYNLAAECPIFDAFLDRIFDGNADLIDYVLRALGYALTGENSENVFFICYGEGANGKSTLMETMRFILGDLAGTVRTEALMQNRFGGNNGHNDDIANLHGRRFVSASEGESGQHLAESLIKQITGGDTISASRKYGRAFQFQPVFALFLATNHVPQISGTDDGIWRRIRLLPFSVQIPESERDPKLKVKLRSEAKGILAKLIQGSTEWYSNGLGSEPDIISATTAYRSEQDTVENFLREMCDLGPGLTAVPASLYDDYRQWCTDNGVDPLNRQRFPAELGRKGYSKRAMKWINNQTRTLWQGIGLRNGFASAVPNTN